MKCREEGNRESTTAGAKRERFIAKKTGKSARKQPK